MKRFFWILVCIFFLSISTSNAQFTKIGGGLNLATSGRYLHNGLEYFNNSLGFDLRAELDITRSIRFVPDFHFFLPKTFDYVLGGESKTTLFALNLNGHFILAEERKLDLYVLGGLHVGGWNIKDKHTESIIGEVDNSDFKVDLAANLGLGVEIKIGRQLGLFADVKYIISKSHQLVFTPGLIYSF